jgi:uroporphyrinogen decarboxylase
VNSRARVEAAIALGEVDRPPAGAWGHTYREEWSPEELARVTLERARRFGWDFVKFQPRASCFAEAFGMEFKPAGHALRAPKFDRGVVSSPADWAKLPTADGRTPPLADQVESIGIVARDLGPEVPVIQTLFSPLTIAGYLVGREPDVAVRHLKREPDAIRPALDRIADMVIDFGRRSVEAGAAGVFYAISGGLAGRDHFTLPDYERLVLPYDLRVLGALEGAGWFNVLHLCGSNLHFELAARMPNINVVSWSIHNRGNPSLAEGREISGRAVMGGLAQRTTLARGTPEAVTKQAREALRATGGRGFFLAPGCSVPPATKPENLVAMMRAAAA